MDTDQRIKWNIMESTTTFEKKFPGLVKNNVDTLRDFQNTFPPQYNLYYPSDNFGTNKFDIILRIFPEYASMIYSGEKKFEFRKYIPRHTGLVFLLETNTHAEFTGCFFFQKVIAEEVNALWKKVGNEAGPYDKFESYFEGKKFGVALEILESERFSKSLSFESVYDKCPDMPKPPHPYVYMYTPVGGKLSTLLRSQLKKILSHKVY
jgi:predicted transcriptional regulator